MLKFNLDRIFALRGITKPIGFLQKIGFTPPIASRISNHKMTSLSPSHVEKLCTALNCSPEDLYEWIPDKPEDDTPSHPLYRLKRKPAVNLSDISMDIPLSKLEEFNSSLNDLKEK